MASNEVPPEASQYYLSTTSHHHRDYQTRKRAVSCTSLPSGGAAGAESEHATVYFPASPHSLSQISHFLTLDSLQRPFEQNGSIDHQNIVGYSSIGSRGITQDGRIDFASPVGSNTGELSALGIEPGPAGGNSHAGICRLQTAPTPLSLADDPSSLSSPLLGQLPGGLTLTVTQALCDGCITVDRTLSKDFEPNSGVSHYFMPSSQCTSPSSPNWPAGQLGTADPSLLYPLHGSRTPSSRSALSSPSFSPLSGFSTLSINSPPSSVGEVDDDGSSRLCLQLDGQAQGGPQWGADGWGPEQGSLSPSSCLDNGAESFASTPFLAVLSTTPASTITDAHASTNEASSSDDPSPSQHSQLLLSRNHYPLEGGNYGMERIRDWQPVPSPQSFPSTPYGISGEPGSDIIEFSTLSRICSDPPATSGTAGPSFSSQVDESYEATYLGYHSLTHSAIAASSRHSTTAADAASRKVYLNRQLGVGRASTRKEGAWCNGTLRAKKVLKQSKNDLLHRSIESLQQRGLIAPMSSLRDTVRSIIDNCFEFSPTRQNIVDLLFGALPERTRAEVVEVEVKKYYKDRIGHILSAPANKNMFVNISGTGRWALG